MFADEAEKSLVCWLNELLMKVVGVLRRENMDWMWKKCARIASSGGQGQSFC
jgi:hypothetical protein